MEEEIHLSCDRCPHVSGGRRIPFHQKQHLGLRSPVKETLLLTYLKPKFCLDSSPSTQNLSFFVSQFLTNVLFLFLTSIKAAGFGHFLGPIYTWPPYAWIKMCLYLLLICFLFILLLVQPQNSRGVEGKKFPLSDNRNISNFTYSYNSGAQMVLEEWEDICNLTIQNHFWLKDGN